MCNWDEHSFGFILVRLYEQAYVVTIGVLTSCYRVACSWLLSWSCSSAQFPSELSFYLVHLQGYMHTYIIRWLYIVLYYADYWSLVTICNV
jgi:hypothetical protein